MSITGTKAATLTHTDTQFVKGQGYVTTLEYRGGVDEINGLIPGLAFGGWEVDARIDPPWATLTATKQARSASQDQEVYDRFTFSTEKVEPEIWSLPAVDLEVQTVWVPNTGDTFAGYRKIIEDAIADGDEGLLPSEATYPTAWKVYRELARGGEAYEDEAFTATRERVVSLLYAGQRMGLRDNNASLIYTNDQWQTQFAIPSGLGVAFPDDARTAPDNTMWGWRSRRQEVRYLEGRRVQIVQDWTFAAWSLFLYSAFTP